MAHSRDFLIDWLVNDYVSSLLNDRHFPYEVAEYGFKGFQNMTDDELRKCAADAGLDDPEET